MAKVISNIPLMDERVIISDFEDSLFRVKWIENAIDLCKDTVPDYELKHIWLNPEMFSPKIADIALGDSGYHYEYLSGKDIKPRTPMYLVYVNGEKGISVYELCVGENGDISIELEE